MRPKKERMEHGSRAIGGRHGPTPNVRRCKVARPFKAGDPQEGGWRSIAERWLGHSRLIP